MEVLASTHLDENYWMHYVANVLDRNYSGISCMIRRFNEKGTKTNGENDVPIKRMIIFWNYALLKTE